MWAEAKLPSPEHSGRSSAVNMSLCPLGLFRDIVKLAGLKYVILIIVGITESRRREATADGNLEPLVFRDIHKCVDSR